MAFNPAFADAIAKIESGGNYGLLGPITKSNDRAYGKYQVMGANIPVWTKEVLGAPMSPQEFLANPQAQDAVFQGKFGQYVDKYGPEGAAQAWFGGPGAVGKLDRKDQLGTSVGSYGQKFMASLGPQSPPVSGPAPSIEPQKPLPPQPLNLAQPAPAPSTPAPAWHPTAAYQEQPIKLAAPLMAPMAPPPIQNLLRQVNLRNQLAQIPVPQGFMGFKYS